MAGASDKVRFYMEQAVPQLREFEEKKIFTKVRTNQHTAHSNSYPSTQHRPLPLQAQLTQSFLQDEIRSLVKIGRAHV